MKLEDLKVIDIIQMPQFEKRIEALIKDLYLTRTKIMNEQSIQVFNSKEVPLKDYKRKRYLGLKLLLLFTRK